MVVLTHGEKKEWMARIQAECGDSPAWPPKHEEFSRHVPGKLASESGGGQGGAVAEQADTGEAGKGQGKGQGKGKGAAAAPKKPPTPKPAKDQGLFLQFEVLVTKRRRNPDFDLGQPPHGWIGVYPVWTPMFDSRLGLGCSRSHEIMQIMIGWPVARHNAEQSAESRVCAGDYLHAVDGAELSEGIDWRQLVDDDSPTCTLTVRRRNEGRKVVSLLRQEDCIVGMMMSGAEAFRLPAEAAGETVTGAILRETVARALGGESKSVSLYDCGRLLEDQEFVDSASMLVAKQVVKPRAWSWNPAGTEQAKVVKEAGEVAEWLPVDYMAIVFKDCRDLVSANMKLQASQNQLQTVALRNKFVVSLSKWLQFDNRESVSAFEAACVLAQLAYTTRGLSIRNMWQSHVGEESMFGNLLDDFAAQYDMIEQGDRGDSNDVVTDTMKRHLETWKNVAKGKWVSEDTAAPDILLAEGLPVDEQPIDFQEVKRTMVVLYPGIGGGGGQWSFGAAAPDWQLHSDVLVEAASLLLSATISSPALQVVHHLFDEGRVDPACAVVANRDLLDILVWAQRWDDLQCLAVEILSAWPTPTDAGKEASIDMQVSPSPERSKRWKVRSRMASKRPACTVTELPIGRGLPLAKADAEGLMRLAITGLTRAAADGHERSLVAIVGLLKGLDATHPQVAIEEKFSELLACVPDEHPELAPILVKCLGIPALAYHALRRISALVGSERLAGAAEAAMEPLRDLIIKLALPPSKVFDLRIDTGEAWQQHPRLAAELEKCNSTVEALGPQLDVRMVDSCGYPVSAKDVDSKAQYIQVRLPRVQTESVSDGSWCRLAPLFLAIIRQPPQAPVLLDSEELLTALCHLSQHGFLESRSLALEAVGILAPRGHTGALEAACAAVTESDACLRTLGCEALVALARPKELPALRERLEGLRDPYATMALRSLETSSART